MRVEKEEFEFWLAVNDEGRRMVSFDGAAEAIAALIEEHGGAAVRTVRMMVSMALPTAVEAEHLEVTEEDANVENIETAIDEVETVAACPLSGRPPGAVSTVCAPPGGPAGSWRFPPALTTRTPVDEGRRWLEKAVITSAR
jgi:hypothetical protein